MVWPLTWIVVAGTLPGVLLGAVVRVEYLPDPKHFKVFAAVVMLYIGVRMIRDLLGKNGGQSKTESEQRFHRMVHRQQGTKDAGQIEKVYESAAKLTHFNLRRFGYTFLDEQFDVSTWGIFSLSLIVGVIGGIYGIGGGAIIAPFFVTFFGLPVYTVAGAALLGTFVTSVAGVFFYQAIALAHPNMSIAPDWLLGIFFGLGGMGGMYLSARCQKHVPARVIKWMLAGVIIFTAIKYTLEAIK